MAILMRGGILKFLVVLFAVGVSWAPAKAADRIRLEEQKIQAGLIYNFLKYTTWPASATSPASKNELSVCLLGGDPFSGNLYPLNGRTAQHYIIKITRPVSVSEAENCDVVFVNSNQEENLLGVLGSLKGKGILTVSNIPSFSKRGGMVEFSKGRDQRIHLYINRAALDAAGLTVNSRLLNLAELGRQ
jgi:hypothetical protein